MKTIEAITASVVIENADAIAGGDMDGFSIFDAIYGPMPVVYRNGEWAVTGPDDFETGCAEDFGDENETITTLAQLASAMNLRPSTFACDMRWDLGSEIDADEVAANDPAVAEALRLAREGLEASKRDEREQRRFAREEQELFDRDEMEAAATNRGDTVEYFAGDTLAEAAEELGMPEDSETARLYCEGKLHRAEALRRAAKISHRHESTNYDDLLRRGIDRDTARDMTEQ